MELKGTCEYALVGPQRTWSFNGMHLQGIF